MRRALLAVGGLPGEAAIVQHVGRPTSGLQVARRCLDLADLLGIAAAEAVDVAVVAAGCRGLDADAVRALHDRGVRVVVVTTAGDDHARWQAMGADAVTGPQPEDVVAAAAVPDRPSPVTDPDASGRGATGRPTLGPSVVPGDGPSDNRSPTTSAQPGRLVAVWGPTGAPGRTTTALTLADELARLGRSALLADADTYGAAVAQQLGLLEDVAGLAAACRLAGQGRLTDEALARVAVTLPSGLGVLTGVPRPDRWSELRPAALGGVWEVALAQHDVVVVDCGFGLERDDAHLFEPGLPCRDAATLATLAAADDVVAVTAADPVSLARLVRAWDDVVALTPTARLQLVVTRVRRSAVGAGAPAQLRRLLAEQVGPVLVTLVPDDPSGYDTALLTGRTLAECVPRSPARRALAGLAADLAADLGGSWPAAAEAARRRRRRPARRGGLRRRVAVP